MRAHTVGAPVPNGTDFQINRLHRTEGPFYSRQVFVCLYRIRGAEFGCWHAGADNIEPSSLASEAENLSVHGSFWESLGGFHRVESGNGI
jgi:hypothetical protein